MCVFANSVNALTRESPTKGGQSKLTVGACLSVCNDNYLDWGGVGNNKGRACLAYLFNEHSSLC